MMLGICGDVGKLVTTQYFFLQVYNKRECLTWLHLLGYTKGGKKRHT